MSMVVRVFLVHGGRTLRASVLVFAYRTFDHFSKRLYGKTVSLAKPIFYFFVLRLKTLHGKLTVHCRNSFFVRVLKITAW